MEDVLEDVRRECELLRYKLGQEHAVRIAAEHRFSPYDALQGIDDELAAVLMLGQEPEVPAMLLAVDCASCFLIDDLRSIHATTPEAILPEPFQGLFHRTGGTCTGVFRGYQLIEEIVRASDEGRRQGTDFLVREHGGEARTLFVTMRFGPTVAGESSSLFRVGCDVTGWIDPSHLSQALVGPVFR